MTQKAFTLTELSLVHQALKNWVKDSQSVDNDYVGNKKFNDGALEFVDGWGHALFLRWHHVGPNESLN